MSFYPPMPEGTSPRSWACPCASLRHGPTASKTSRRTAEGSLTSQTRHGELAHLRLQVTDAPLGVFDDRVVVLKDLAGVLKQLLALGGDLRGVHAVARGELREGGLFSIWGFRNPTDTEFRGGGLKV